MTDPVLAARRRKVRQLREDGLSVREIAEKLGASKTAIGRDVKAIDERAPMPAGLKPWPPPEPGNQRALTHGCDSPGLVQPRAHELVPGIIEANPHLDVLRDALAVHRYAVRLARLERAYAWLDAQPDDVFADVDSGRVHSLYNRIADWEAAADRAEERLAISPRERTRLKLDQVRGRLLMGGGRVDFKRLSDVELDEFTRLREKALLIEGDATEVLPDVAEGEAAA